MVERESEGFELAVEAREDLARLLGRRAGRFRLGGKRDELAPEPRKDFFSHRAAAPPRAPESIAATIIRCVAFLQARLKTPAAFLKPRAVLFIFRRCV
jgi:hypothetical protein